MDIAASLSCYVKVCLPVVGARTAFPKIYDPNRKAVEKEFSEAIAAKGWPAGLEGVLALQLSAENALDKDTVAGTPTYVALLGIELACNERMASQAIQCHGDCVAKLIWLRRDLLGAVDECGWIKSLDDVIAWQRH